MSKEVAKSEVIFVQRPVLNPVQNTMTSVTTTTTTTNFNRSKRPTGIGVTTFKFKFIQLTQFMQLITLCNNSDKHLPVPHRHAHARRSIRTLCIYMSVSLARAGDNRLHKADTVLTHHSVSTR